MIHADDADRQKTHEVGGIRRPEMEERGDDISRIGRDAQLQHEEGRGDRENAVAECLEPARPHLPSLMRVAGAG